MGRRWTERGVRKFRRRGTIQLWSRIHNYLERAWPVVLDGSTQIAFSISPGSTNEEFTPTRRQGQDSLASNAKQPTGATTKTATTTIKTAATLCHRSSIITSLSSLLSSTEGTSRWGRAIQRSHGSWNRGSLSCGVTVCANSLLLFSPLGTMHDCSTVPLIFHCFPPESSVCGSLLSCTSTHHPSAFFFFFFVSFFTVASDCSWIPNERRNHGVIILTLRHHQSNDHAHDDSSHLQCHGPTQQRQQPDDRDEEESSFDGR
jgi:hypothetical protein